MLKELLWTGERYLPNVEGDVQIEHMHRYFVALNLVRDKNVLDIACGEGYGSNLLADEALTVTGIDISSDAIEHAQQKYAKENLRFVQGDCTAIALADNSIDVVVSFETIEHHDKHKVFLREIKRVLKPDGLLIISSPDKREYTDSTGHNNQFHVKELYLTEFENLIKENFKHHTMLGQRIKYGSLIAPLKEARDSAFVNYKMDHKRMIHEETAIFNPLYFLAVASDCEIPPPCYGLYEHPVENSEPVRTLANTLRSKSQEFDSLSNEFEKLSSEHSTLSSEHSTLSSEYLTMKKEHGLLLDKTQQLKNELTNRDIIIGELLNSTSWYITKPIRWSKNQLTCYQQILNHIWNSTRWRLTGHLRSIAIFQNRLLRIIKLAPSAIKHGNGIKNTIFKAAAIYQNEGTVGLSRALSSLRAPTPARSIDTVQTSTKKPDCSWEIPRIDFDQTCNRFVEYHENPPISPLVKLIAFYLPQFHPFPENDEWWGKGFTEWTNVGKARPNYIGHHQPHCPIHHGYYDLRVPEVMEEQAKLAKEYGIYGFSYYFYWFAGKILMETPLELMLANKNVDIPFCFTWANENWNRRWDGQENDILIAQEHSDEDSLAFIRHLVKYFHDERYIRIDGKPVLIIYRANIIPNIASTAKIWRDELLKHGLPSPYLISAQSFGISSPKPFDFDASMEFPPHTARSEDITNEIELINADYNGRIYSYEQVTANALLSKEPEYKLYRTTMLSWDNTARKQNNSHIFHHFSLLRYKQWLSSIVNKVYSNPKYSPDEKIVFVNAWNEWAEGTHLEPDQKFGYGYLQTTYDVLRNYEAVPLSKLNEPYTAVKQSDYAVVLHLHYEELWPNISDYLMESFEECSFDLYVSVTSSTAAQKVLADFPDASIGLVENRGRDILPFIRMLKFIKNLGYIAVCKIHSKRSVYRNDGDSIRDELLEALVGSKEQVENILFRFRDNPQLGMVVPKNYLIKHNDRNMTFNNEAVHKVSQKMHINFQYDIFPAGSMFWFSPKSLAPLHTIDDTFFEIESGLADGTCAHAIERLFCQIVRNRNYTIESC